MSNTFVTIFINLKIQLFVHVSSDATFDFNNVVNVQININLDFF